MTTYRPSSRGTSGLPANPRVYVTRPPAEQGEVPRAVVALLDALRALERSLALWALGQVDAGDVSDVFVAAGDRFNAARAALHVRGIDTTDLAEFLPELRSVLEDRLSDDPTPQNTNAAREEGRIVIQKLLVRLRDKSPLYWQSETGREGMIDSR